MSASLRKRPKCCAVANWRDVPLSRIQPLGAVGGVNEMNSALSAVREREATLAFDKPYDERAALIRLDSRQSATERRPPDKSTAASLLLRFLYWIYERRLLDQLKQGRYRTISASSWMEIVAMLASGA